jgi:hypothetical protein
MRKKYKFTNNQIRLKIEELGIFLIGYFKLRLQNASLYDCYFINNKCDKIIIILKFYFTGEIKTHTFVEATKRK